MISLPSNTLPQRNPMVWARIILREYVLELVVLCSKRYGSPKDEMRPSQYNIFFGENAH
jgi:hypothetical protein